METVYNHDLNVSPQFLESYPRIRHLLRDPRVVREFDRYDAEAKVHKRRFHRIGLWSLILGLVPLLVAAGRLMAGDSLFERTSRAAFAFDGLGILAIALVALNRAGRHRVKWCRAMFFRERIRQWHFQMFLDGPLMEQACTADANFMELMNTRWQALEEDIRGGESTVATFVNAASERHDFFHERASYRDEALSRMIFAALERLRIEHQLRYAVFKVTAEGESLKPTLPEQESISETIANSTLGGAVLIAAVSFLVPFTPWDRTGPDLGHLLAGGALLLALASAGVRAYRAGFTLPDELESYEEYRARLREIREVFRSVTSTEEKLRQLEALEAESIGELRRFLRMKKRATFLF